MYEVTTFTCAYCDNNFPVDELSLSDLSATNGMSADELAEFLVMEDVICIHCEEKEYFEDDGIEDAVYRHNFEDDGGRYIDDGRRAFLNNNY